MDQNSGARRDVSMFWAAENTMLSFFHARTLASSSPSFFFFFFSLNQTYFFFSLF